MGGTTGQVLAKSSGENYSTEWITPSGGGGDGPSLGANTIIVAGHSEPADVKAAAHYVCDNTADQVEINQAINQIASLSVMGNAKGTNGGTVLLVGREFTITGPVLVQSQTTLKGAYGKDGTWLRCHSSYAPGANGGMIELAHLDTQYTTIRDLGLRVDGVNVCGIRLQMGAGQEYDGYHTVTEVHMWHPGSHGLYVLNNSGGRMRGCHFSFIRILDPDGYGVYTMAPDSFYSHIDVGSAGSGMAAGTGHGFMIGHSNNRYVNCKAWFADGDGFNIAGGRDNQLVGYESQDNERHGYYIGSARTVLSSCTADSNSHTGSGDASGGGDGFHIVGNGANVHGTASDKNESNRGRQQRYGVNVTNGSVRCIVNVTTWGNATAALNGTGHATSVVNVVDTPV